MNKRFTFDEAFAMVPGHGWLTEDEARVLWDALDSVKAVNVLEVGTYYGRSATIIAAYLSILQDSHFVMCDPFDDGHHFLGVDTPEAKAAIASVEAKMKETGMDNRSTLVLKPDLVFAAMQRQTKPYDAIYLDGNHTFEATKASIDAWLPHLRPGGVMCLHDYCNDGGGREIVRAVECSPRLSLKLHVGRMAVCNVSS